MADFLFKKLCDINLLRKAWHLARYDSQRNDFIQDPLGYSDFTYNLENNLKEILRDLEEEQYHPKPLINIDIPKSTLAVRPGGIISIEDKIVCFAIISLIAPNLDKQLPETVYSYRLKKSNDKRSLFRDLEILKFPLLKGRTIRRRVDIWESWYHQWPKFIEKTIYTFEEQGYRFLTKCDIAAYFENINLSILRDILMKYFSKEQKLVNLLFRILNCWTWLSAHGRSVERGIPQGSDVGSFLGNIYLLPVDEEFLKFGKGEDIRYFRYSDDVMIFSKEPKIARECIFAMNNALRKLHLNIQGSKTQILGYSEIRSEMIDKRLEEVNEVIEKIQKSRRSITQREREEHLNRLRRQHGQIRKRNTIQGKDLRLYRRLITGFVLLESSYMIDSILKEIPRNPDVRFLNSTVRYFKSLPGNWKKISRGLINFLLSRINVFPYQEARIMEACRYLCKIPKEVAGYARKCLRTKNKHWYVRVQSALLLGNLDLPKRSLKSLKRIYECEQNVEIKRSLIKALCQIERSELDDFLGELVFENDNRLSSIGRMLTSIRRNTKSVAIKEIARLFRSFQENALMESYYKIEVAKYCNHKFVTEDLLKRLKRVRVAIKREHLKKRVTQTIKFLENRI